jgi:glycosyltransferase involved in cell wall biosynthesis
MSRALTNPARKLARGTHARPADTESRRVTFLTDIPTPYMLEVLKSLANLVDLTVLFCSQTGSRGMPWASNEKLPFDYRVINGLTITRGSPGGSPDRPDYYLSPRVLPALAGSRAEAVVSAGFSVPTGYAAIHCRLHRSPLVIYSDGTSYYERDLGRHQLVARAVLLRAASTCVAKSKPAVERFVELGVRPERVFLAPHSSTLDPLWQIARERKYERGEKLTILTAGRLVPHKGVDKLLRAAALTREDHPEIRLVVVGAGPEKARLRLLASELGLEVEFAGFVDHRDMPARYAQADAFVFPTLDDPFGIVLLEAAAAGLPLIASPRAGATWDLIRNPQDGLIVDPNDSAGLAGALRELAVNPQLRKSLGQRARATTLGRSPMESARGYVSAIEAAVRHPGRAKR